VHLNSHRESENRSRADSQSAADPKIGRLEAFEIAGLGIDR
jgi:hypothetical protein